MTRLTVRLLAEQLLESLDACSGSLNSAPVARNDSRCGRAGYPDQVSPAGTSPNTPDCPAILRARANVDVTTDTRLSRENASVADARRTRQCPPAP